MARWQTPRAILLHLARQARLSWCAHHQRPSGEAGLIVWIGQRVWPQGGALCRVHPAATGRGPGADGHSVHSVHSWSPLDVDDTLLRWSLFINAATPDDRLWAADTALRCPAVAAVCVDGSGWRMPATRRLQLVAEQHRGLALVARPPWERSVLSAALTRWSITTDPISAHEVSDHTMAALPDGPRWRIGLERCRHAASLNSLAETSWCISGDPGRTVLEEQPRVEATPDTSRQQEQAA